jgi:hypothetical protein
LTTCRNTAKKAQEGQTMPLIDVKVYKDELTLD